MSVAPRTRHTRSNPCRVCGGWDDARLRGRGVRCFGFDSEDGKWITCTREEHAGGLVFRDSANGFCHKAEGDCRCGIEHAPAPIVPPAGPATYRNRKQRYNEPEGTIDHYYVYYDADGRPLHRVVRYRNPKDFRPERYVKGRGWLRGMKDTKPVLYRLPQLIAADKSLPVIFTEGEKDADRLASLGLVVTCTMHAHTWEPYYVDWLKGRSVLICEDNDKDGRRQARRIKDALSSQATARVLSFPRLPEGGDVSDWLDLGGSVDKLLEAARTPALDADRVA